MTDQIIPPSDLPDYIRLLLNGLAFLAASFVVYYAYFVRGKKATEESTGLPSFVSGFDAKIYRKIGNDIGRLADSAEAIHRLLEKEANELEINRRVKAELNSKRSRKKNDDES